MSILPSLNPGSTSSSSSDSKSQSSTSNHGFLSSDSPPHQSQHNHLQISGSPPPPPHLSGQVAPASHSSVGSSQEVKVPVRQNHGEGPAHPNRGKTLHQSAFVPTSSHQSAASSSSSGHSGGKKAQMFNGNHLLNFQYDPVSRPQARRTPPPPRRQQQKRKPYNKDLFLQANYRFVVLDSGNYAAADSMDPDKMLCWENIICLNYSTPFNVQCPICLDDPPLCPQITSCGHIFCFPCILQYFSMYEDDLKDEHWKKCPLCFAMISSKDLYTIRIENVKQYHVGDEIEFVLLTRQKDSFNSSIRNSDIEEEILRTFSKFTLTSDVDLSVREAMSELDSWIARAESGLVDDIEKLPYVCAAMKQLEQRKKYWNTYRINGGDKTNASLDANNSASEFVQGAMSTNKNDKLDRFGKSSLEDHDRSPNSSFDDSKYSHTLANGISERKDGDAYNFYQAVDGQHIILHPLSMRCLLHHYGSYESLPNRITAKILQLETVTQSEAIRRRYRFLSHFSLTTTFQLCELDLGDILPAESLSPFMDEIKNRENQRKRLAKKELKDKIKAEAAGSQFVHVPYYSYNDTPSYSMDDFEALGTPAVASSSPPTIGERQSFSSVARLGFAAACDSPALKFDEIQSALKIDKPDGSSSSIGLRNGGGAASFANVTSREKKVEVPPHKANEVGKKGKKGSRILMSTAGGRRY